VDASAFLRNETERSENQTTETVEQADAQIQEKQSRQDLRKPRF
jgi:hypothetical protein